MRSREGFALMAALWIVLTIASLSMALALTSRSRRLSVDSRITILRTDIALDGCELAASTILAQTAAQQTVARPGAGNGWSNIPHGNVHAASPSRDVRCTISFEDAGARWNVNASDSAQIVAFLTAGGADKDHIESVAQAIQGRKRLNGGIRENDYIELLELGLPVQIFKNMRLYGDARISLQTAPLDVLTGIPGVTPRIATQIDLLRRTGQLTQLSDVTRVLGSEDRDAFVAHLPEIERASTAEPVQIQATISTDIRDSRSGSARIVGFTRNGSSVQRVWSIVP